MTDNLPTVRNTHDAGYLCVLVWCKACHHQAPSDESELFGNHLKLACVK